MISDYSSAELRDIVNKVNEILRLLSGLHIVEVDILVAPFEVMDDPFISKLLLHNEYILEEINNSLLDVKVVKLGNHSLLVLKILLILINQSISFVYHTSNVVKDRSVRASL